MTKTIKLTIGLVPEAAKIKAASIKRDVLEESQAIVHSIPWAAEIKKIEVE
jgi:hypothetical protein